MIPYLYGCITGIATMILLSIALNLYLSNQKVGKDIKALIELKKSGVDTKFKVESNVFISPTGFTRRLNYRERYLYSLAHEQWAQIKMNKLYVDPEKQMWDDWDPQGQNHL